MWAGEGRPGWVGFDVEGGSAGESSRTRTIDLNPNAWIEAEQKNNNNQTRARAKDMSLTASSQGKTYIFISQQIYRAEHVIVVKVKGASRVKGLAKSHGSLHSRLLSFPLLGLESAKMLMVVVMMRGPGSGGPTRAARVVGMRLRHGRMGVVVLGIVKVARRHGGSANNGKAEADAAKDGCMSGQAVPRRCAGWAAGG